jgi:Eco29kI restriction endonuclease
MVGRASKRGASAEKKRCLDESLEVFIAGPPYVDGFDPVSVSRSVMERLPNANILTKPQAKKLRDGFDNFVKDLAEFRQRLDPIRDPDGIFDPGNPDTVGRLVVIALLAQDKVPLLEISPTYGSGVYAIYYTGQHPAYSEITRTETPIYVGKADPDEPRAATPRQQGARLFGRLADHRKVIQMVERYALTNNLPDPLLIADFECRRMVCATNAQLVAEKHLIEIFRPAWNQESKICFGMSKHGDSSDTRRNKKSPWDVLHPGRDWALNSPVRVNMTSETVAAKLVAHFTKYIPIRDQDSVMETILDKFRQVARAPAEISAAASEADEVVAAIAQDARQDRDDPELDFNNE